MKVIAAAVRCQPCALTRIYLLCFPDSEKRSAVDPHPVHRWVLGWEDSGPLRIPKCSSHHCTTSPWHTGTGSLTPHSTTVPRDLHGTQWLLKYLNGSCVLCATVMAISSDGGQVPGELSGERGQACPSAARGQNETNGFSQSTTKNLKICMDFCNPHLSPKMSFHSVNEQERYF